MSVTFFGHEICEKVLNTLEILDFIRKERVSSDQAYVYPYLRASTPFVKQQKRHGYESTSPLFLG